MDIWAWMTQPVHQPRITCCSHTVLARLAPRRRIAPAIRSAAPAPNTAPAASKPTAIPSRSGYVAPRSARTWIPGRPSAFITTTVHDPLAGAHRRVWVPGPAAAAAQKPWVLGADPDVLPPIACTLSPQKSEITV